jgi:hypothetical protein
MLGLYYRIWTDCITRLKLQPANKYDWPRKSMFIMSIAMTFNFALLMSILQRPILGYYFYKLDIPFLSRYVNNVVSFVILFVMPCVIVNYLLIFRNKRYDKLLKRYPYYNGKLIVTYFLISMFLPIVLLAIGMIFLR